MTTALPSSAHGLSDRVHLLPIGIGASVVQALMMIPGYNQDGGFDSAWYGMTAVSILLAIAVFTLAVPHGGGTTAVVLGVLAVLGCVAFWTMLSFPLAAGAAVVGMRVRQQVADRTRGTVGVALAAFAVVATIAITIGDMIAGD